jgi:hypothetical protein
MGCCQLQLPILPLGKEESGGYMRFPSKNVIHLQFIVTVTNWLHKSDGSHRFGIFLNIVQNLGTLYA